MATALEIPVSADTAAARQAANHFQINIATLARFQAELIDRLTTDEGDIGWMFARDGYLTCRDETRWWSECSVPMRAGRQLLKKLELSGTLGCFLHPGHAAQVRAAFEKILPTQAILVVIPDLRELRILLHCDDFSAEIGAGRLFFAGGPDWAGELEAIFKKFPGLPLPQQFLRTALLDDGEMSELSTEAQTVISRETTRRAERLPEIFTHAANRPKTGRIVVLASSRLNLADFSNMALRKAIDEPSQPSRWTVLDPDHPFSAAPLALADAVKDADGLVTADLFRADLSGVVPPQTVWITWVTNGRIASHDPRFPADVLLLADPAWRPTAVKAGWPTASVHIAAWPQIVPTHALPAGQPVIALLANTLPIQIPQKFRDFSSQSLLWQYVEEELAKDPLALGRNPDQYLESRRQRFDIPDQMLDSATFLDRLIAPAYQQAMARRAINNGYALALIGRGWDQLPEFAPYAVGDAQSVADLARLLGRCHLLLEPFPTHCSVAAALPLPLIRPAEISVAGAAVKLQKSLRRHKLDQDEPLLNSAIIASHIHA